MNNLNTRPMELLLEVIADELLLARMDRENELGIGSTWKENDRASCVERIKKAQEHFDRYPDL